MKRVAIGAVLLFAGLGAALALVFAAAAQLPALTAWSNAYPSKLLYVIFSGMSRYDGGASGGFGPGWLFVAGCGLAVLGLAALGREYFRK